METKSAAVIEVLDKDNYVQWKVRVQTYLKAQDLWEDIIEQNDEAEQQTNDEAEQQNDEAAISARRKKNFTALHAIHISCGPNAFSEIMGLTSARDAWNTLAEKFSVRDELDAVNNNSYVEYADLYAAVRRGDWNAAKDFLELHAEAVNKEITDKGETALHIAVTVGHVHVVEELVKLMSEEDLEIEDSDGYTALMTAVVHGKYRMAECMLSRNKKLISFRNSGGNDIPVVTAIDFGQIEMARYLYPLTSLKDLMPAENDHNGATLFTRAISTGTLDVALDLIHRCPTLALALDSNGESPFLALASMRHSFPSGNRLVFWKQWIYSCIHIQLAPATNETRLNIPKVEKRQSNQPKTIGSVLRHLVSSVLNFLGIKQLYEMKKIHVQSRELLSRMCDEISKSNTQQLTDGRVYTAINRAVKNGIFEFVFKTLSTDPRLLSTEDRHSRNIFMLAVLHRRAKIFSLIYRLDMKNALASYGDYNDNNMLHMAGMIEDSTILNRIPGAALQMQRELQWFKEVERIVHPKVKEGTNKDGLTPRQLFTKNHKDMLKEGEQWMKDTATSCTVVGALIVTTVFAAAFTIPGGNDQNTGFPMFLKKKMFMVFIISDALSLFSSSTSVLMFLGILTSRYGEDDFLESLPRKMIIGLSTLFFSIVAMMIAFSTGLLIMLREHSWIVIPVICFATVPVTLFVLMQFPLLVDMTISTYGPGIFNRKLKLDFN